MSYQHRKSIFGCQNCYRLYLMHCDSLLQNVKDIITKCDGYFITKCDRGLLQNTSAFLEQFYYKIATVITKCDNFITKMMQLLQNASFITNCGSIVIYYLFKFTYKIGLP